MEEHDHARLISHRVSPIRRTPGLEEDVITGLMSRPRSMPPKYFYDKRGSRLFDAICETPEYYPTRTEEALLSRHAGDIIARVAPEHIVEFGSGTARKTRLLFDACDDNGEPAAYWPFDVCEAMLMESGRQLLREYDWLQVHALVGDYLGGLRNVPRATGRRLFLFLGGTIGNFTSQQAEQFLNELLELMDVGDYLLLGADRVKDTEVLHAAYNDKSGITAEFNLNLMRMLNRELDADFRLEQFRHEAVFNPRASQIEMYLVSCCEQSVYLGALDTRLRFSAGEKILTEISRKFTASNLEMMLYEAGFDVEHHFEPQNGYFSLLLARPA